MQIESNIFDFDGVIIESVDIKGWAFGKLFECYPEYVDEITAFHYANGGMSRFDKFRYIYDHILNEKLSEEKFECLCFEFSKLVYHRVIGCKYVEGAEEFLNKYHDKISFFIISGTPHDEMLAITKARRIIKYFKGIYGSPTTKSVWIKSIIEEQKIDPEQIIFVGDALSDYDAAKEHNIFFIGRLNNSQENVFKDKEIDLLINNFYELDNYISQFVF